jgi:mRNA interferase MazF
MTNYRKWDIVLVPFPFTDLTSIKKRPALIISPDDHNKSDDVVLMMITSNLKSSKNLYDYKLLEWDKSGLPKPSMTKMRVSTIKQTIILKKIGTLQSKDIKNIQKLVLKFFS